MAIEDCLAGIQTANLAIPERAQAIMNMFHLRIIPAPYPSDRRPKRLGMLVSV